MNIKAPEYIYSINRIFTDGYITKRKVISVKRIDDYGLFVQTTAKHPFRFSELENGQCYFHNDFFTEEEARKMASKLRKARIEYHKRAIGRLEAVENESIVEL